MLEPTPTQRMRLWCGINLAQMAPHRVVFLAAVLVGIPLVTGLCHNLAQAQGRANAGDRAAMDAARRHMEQAQGMYLQGRFAEAAMEFTAAHEAQPFPAFLFNAGVARENAGDLAGAITAFEQYVREETRERDRRPVEQRLERVRARLAAETAAAANLPPGETPSVTPTVAPTPTALPDDFKSIVNVRTTPEGATISVRASDGSVVASGPSPFVEELSHGEYHLVIEHPDFNRAEETIHVDPGKVYVVVLNLSQGEFRGTLHVATDTPGAQVFIDAHEEGARGVTPFEADLRVGRHHLWIEKPGYVTLEQDVDIAIGDTANLQLSLVRVDYARLRVVSNVRGAHVMVDAREVGTIPWEGDMPPGAHDVVVSAGGMKTYRTRVELQRGQVTPVRVRLRPAPDRSAGWVSAAASVIALGGGIATSVYVGDLGGQLTLARDRGNLSSRDPRIDLGYYASIGADAAFGLSLVLAGVATFYFLVDNLPPSEGNTLDARDWTDASGAQLEDIEDSPNALQTHWLPTVQNDIAGTPAGVGVIYAF